MIKTHCQNRFGKGIQNPQYVFFFILLLFNHYPTALLHRKNIWPFKTNGFKYYNKVSMIVSDSTAHGGHAFHPAMTKPPAADDDDGEDNNNDGVDNTPIDPSAVQAVVASALTTASLTASSQFSTDTLSSHPL